MKEETTILGMPVFVSETAPPNTIRIIDAYGILKYCPRDAQGRVILVPEIVNKHVVSMLIAPVKDTEP